MLLAVLLRLGLASLAATATGAGLDDTAVTSPRAAQQLLAATLAAADAIESVTANDRAIRFVIARDGELLDVVVTTRAGGAVASLAIRRSRDAAAETGSLSWLARELAEVTAITRLEVDGDGAVVVTTSDRRRYLAIAGRARGNTAVEARWAAAWDAPPP